MYGINSVEAFMIYVKFIVVSLVFIINVFILSCAALIPPSVNMQAELTPIVEENMTKYKPYTYSQGSLLPVYFIVPTYNYPCKIKTSLTDSHYHSTSDWISKISVERG